MELEIQLDLRIQARGQKTFYFHVIKLRSADTHILLVFNRGDTVSRRSPIKGVRPSPYNYSVVLTPRQALSSHPWCYVFLYDGTD